MFLINGNVFLITTIAMYPHNFQGFANIMMTNIAGIAMAAGNDGVYGNVISYRCVFYIFADLNDFADKFMTYDTRIGSKGIFPMIDAYIRAANARCFHFN